MQSVSLFLRAMQHRQSAGCNPQRAERMLAGLRALQGRKELERLVKKVKQTRDGMPWGAAGPPPLLVKVCAPRIMCLMCDT